MTINTQMPGVGMALAAFKINGMPAEHFGPRVRAQRYDCVGFAGFGVLLPKSMGPGLGFGA